MIMTTMKARRIPSAALLLLGCCTGVLCFAPARHGATMRTRRFSSTCVVEPHRHHRFAVSPCSPPPPPPAAVVAAAAAPIYQHRPVTATTGRLPRRITTRTMVYQTTTTVADHEPIDEQKLLLRNEIYFAPPLLGRTTQQQHPHGQSSPPNANNKLAIATIDTTEDQESLLRSLLGECAQRRTTSRTTRSRHCRGAPPAGGGRGALRHQFFLRETAGRHHARGHQQHAPLRHGRPGHVAVVVGLG